MNAETVVEQALADAASGKVISIPSRRYQTLMFIIQHAPRAAVRAVAGDVVQPPLIRAGWPVSAARLRCDG